MTRSQNVLDDLFLTTNQDYGSFYSGRLQHCQINPEQIALELSINDEVRNERRQFPSIAYDIIFDKHHSLKIVAHNKKSSKPVMSRRHLKYIKSKDNVDGERQMTIKNALEYYISLIKCIYMNSEEKNPQLSTTVLELVANELFLLNPDLSADELAENMIAVTVPSQCLGMPVIDPNKAYPGTEADCGKSPGLRRLLDRFQSVKKAVDETKQQFDSQTISCQPMEGVRYIYNPVGNVTPSYRI